MKTVDGDLIALALNGEFNVIIHGCNCFCTMGAGIARAIKTEFPEAYTADTATKKGDRDKLGRFSSTTVTRDGHSITVVNAYTQYHYRGSGNKANYPAIASVMKAIKAAFPGKRIGYPLIGAGLAGGDWSIIAPLIDRALVGEDHTLVRFVPA